MTQGQVLGLSHAEQRLEFVLSPFLVSTQGAEQVELSNIGVFFLSHWPWPFAACFCTFTKAWLNSRLVESQLRRDPDPEQDLWLEMKRMGKVGRCPLELNARQQTSSCYQVRDSHP